MPFKSQEEKRAYSKNYYLTIQKERRRGKREELNALQRKRTYARKLKILRHYSGSPPRCAVCGEEDLVVLCIDHINGGGAKHRRELGKTLSAGGGMFYNWLVKNSFPEGFQVLCANCNIRKVVRDRELYAD